MLPFTRDAFIAVFVDYNEAVWPLQVLAYLIGVSIAALLFRPALASGRLIAAGLAAMWLWTGIVYHGIYFSTIQRCCDPLRDAVHAAGPRLLIRRRYSSVPSFRVANRTDRLAGDCTDGLRGDPLPADRHLAGPRLCRDAGVWHHPLPGDHLHVRTAAAHDRVRDALAPGHSVLMDAYWRKRRVLTEYTTRLAAAFHRPNRCSSARIARQQSHGHGSQSLIVGKGTAGDRHRPSGWQWRRTM